MRHLVLISIIFWLACHVTKPVTIQTGHVDTTVYVKMQSMDLSKPVVIRIPGKDTVLIQEIYVRPPVERRRDFDTMILKRYMDNYFFDFRQTVTKGFEKQQKGEVEERQSLVSTLNKLAYENARLRGIIAKKEVEKKQVETVATTSKEVIFDLPLTLYLIILAIAALGFCTHFCVRHYLNTRIKKRHRAHV